MKIIITMLLLSVMGFSYAACSGKDSESTTSQDNLDSEATVATEQSASTLNESMQNDSSQNEPTQSEPTHSEQTEDERRILVAFFSRTGENYGVGVIEKGNTHIIADMIADEMGAYTFEIARTIPYSESYDECTDEAKDEKEENARPELTATVDSFDEYDVVFLGYPNWWGDMPMPVYTFLESYDFSGKTVIPFCTHAGSGLSSTVQTLTDKLTDSTVLDGFAIRGTTAQNEQSEAQEAVLEWLGELGIKK